MLAPSSWTILCILSFRPLTTKSYELPTNTSGTRFDYAAAYATNEKWYQTARVIQSITGILTIPLTSALCSAAAVVFVQRHGKDSNITMRQLLALADKGWTDTSLYWQLVRNPKIAWKRYFSSFLVIAIVLHILGALVSPLQALLLSTKAIKVASYLDQSSMSMPDVFAGDDDVNLDAIAAAAIPALSSTTTNDYDQLLWRSTTKCSRYNEYCGVGITEADLPHLSDPFLTPLPNGYNTGVLRQYAPRMNSSAKVTYIQPSEFPQNCTPYNLHVHYHGNAWEVDVCGPHYGSWNASRDRQDLSEDLFINITILCEKFPNRIWRCIDKTLLKITAHTTVGWFELPNYMNSGEPGPLQRRDPTGRDQSPQHFERARRDPKYDPNGLYLDDAEFSNRTHANGVRYCSRPPLGNLYQYDGGSLLSKPAIDRRDLYEDRFDEISLLDWLASFNQNATAPLALDNAWAAGLYIVNEAWIKAARGYFEGSFTVSSDPGKDTSIPTISLAGLLVISALLFIYLGSLLSVASYAAFVPRWTQSMNGFAMMRIGSAIADRVPLLVTYREQDISAMDDLPGWIGSSASTDNCGVANKQTEFVTANLELGSPHALQPDQKYTCYPGDYKAVLRAEATRRLGDGFLRANEFVRNEIADQYAKK
ncbi:hypothetical protein N7461_009220 [Penicillium sp. DV-2018c]|nr:hypothetical protein N7461_009220 [Penicillium sp. DV-2018c]